MCLRLGVQCGDVARAHRGVVRVEDVMGALGEPAQILLVLHKYGPRLGRKVPQERKWIGWLVPNSAVCSIR